MNNREEMAPTNWVQKFKTERTKFYDFTNEVRRVLQKNLETAQVDVFNIEARTKSIDSFEEKITREGKNYVNPLQELTDLSACRVITYYNEDIERIDEIVRENFDVDEDNSEHKDKISNPKEFGYLSRHLIVSFNQDRIKLNEYKRFEGMRVEIQIRSVLQHAWAAIEHKLQYKRNEDVPQPLQRRLFQISAILELADDQFAFLKHEIGKLRNEYRDNLSKGSYSFPLNIDSIDIYLEQSDLLQRLSDRLDDNGINIAPRPVNAKNPLTKLIATLELAKVKNVEELDALIKSKHEDNWISMLSNVFESWQKAGITSVGSHSVYLGPPKLVLDQTALVRIMVLLSDPQSIKDRILEEIPFGDRLQQALKNLENANP